jgi:hypothetical protein
MSEELDITPEFAVAFHVGRGSHVNFLLARPALPGLDF